MMIIFDQDKTVFFNYDNVIDMYLSRENIWIEIVYAPTNEEVDQMYKTENGKEKSNGVLQ